MRALAPLALLLIGGCGLDEAGRLSSALGAGHVLFLDFAGGAVSMGAADDATASVSALGAATIPAFDGTVPAPKISRAQAIAVLRDRVRGLYLPFDLDVVDTRPTSGDYAAVLVGGTSAALSPPQPAGVAGLASLDCGDTNPRSLGFAFADSLAPQFGGVPSLAVAIAHEAGHGYGLQHSTTPRDPMYSVAVPGQTLDDLFALAFQSGDYSPFTAGGGSQPERCGHASPIDDAALLMAALGPRATPLGAAPTVALDFPPERAVLPTHLPVEVTATDDVAVVRVEVYRDLELVAVLEAPPYRAVLELAPASATTLTIEAVDAEAQRARVARRFEVAADAPAVCDDAMPCAAPQRCVDRFCAPPPLDAGVDAAGPDLGMPPEEGGCAIAGRQAGRTPMALWLLLFLKVGGLVRRRADHGLGPRRR